MKKISIILLLAVVLLSACSPLRKAQRTQKADSATLDRSEIRKAVTDILRESGTLSQTVVEFYPPPAIPSADKPTADSSVPAAVNPDAGLAARQPPTPAPAIKRIVRTEINTEAERITSTDSAAHNDIRATVRSELEDKVAEKPPSSVMAIKWIAAGLIALLLIIVILKFSGIKLPRIRLWQNRD